MLAYPDYWGVGCRFSCNTKNINIAPQSVRGRNIFVILIGVRLVPTLQLRARTEANLQSLFIQNLSKNVPSQFSIICYWYS